MSFTNDQTVTVVKPDTWNLVWKQTKLKWHMFQGSFLFVILAQLFGIITSVSDRQSMSASFNESSNFIELIMTTYNGQSIIILSLVATFGLSFALGLKQTKEVMASFVTSHKVHFYSSFIFIVLMSIGVAISAYLLSFVTKAFIFQFFVTEQTAIVTTASMGEIVKGMVATILYALLFNVLAYFLAELFSSFKVVFGIVVLAFVAYAFTGFPLLYVAIVNIDQFIYREPSLILFACKIIGIVIVLAALTITMTRKREVRF